MSSAVLHDSSSIVPSCARTTLDLVLPILPLAAMSLQINLTGRDLSQAYQDVLDARGIDWALFTYEKGTNDLKLQSTGDGGLEELEDEFSDGR